jgi:hypothetical protein
LSNLIRSGAKDFAELIVRSGSPLSIAQVVERSKGMREALDLVI